MKKYFFTSFLLLLPLSACIVYLLAVNGKIKMGDYKYDSSIKAIETKASVPKGNDEFLKATVKLKCDMKSGTLHYYGSGFVISHDRIVTAAHVLYQTKGDTCEVFFPDSTGKPQYSARAYVGDRVKMVHTYENEFKDVAVMQLLPIENYPSLNKIFNNKYPSISLPICDSNVMLNDSVSLYGYPRDPDYLKVSLGNVYGFLHPMSGIRNADEYVIDWNIMVDEVSAYLPEYLHQYIEVSVKTALPSGEGNSGGPAVNKTQKCIIGPISGYKDFQNNILTSAMWLFQEKDIVQ